MKKRVIILLLIVSAFNSSYLSLSGQQLTNDQKIWLSKANRHEKNGWIYLHIEGSPEERGFQHGYLLAKEIKDALFETSTVWHYQTALDWQWMVQKIDKMFTPGIDAENLQEIDGIVEGMKAAGMSTSRAEIVAYNLSLIHISEPTRLGMISY